MRMMLCNIGKISTHITNNVLRNSRPYPFMNYSFILKTKIHYEPGLK